MRKLVARRKEMSACRGARLFANKNSSTCTHMQASLMYTLARTLVHTSRMCVRIRARVPGTHTRKHTRTDPAYYIGAA